MSANIKISWFVALLISMIAASVYFVQSKGMLFHAPPDQRNPQLTIQIQPFDDILPDKVNYAFKEIKKVYSNTVLLTPVNMPRQAYYKPRNRYRADTIIAWLSRRTIGNYVTIGLTSKDISTDRGKIIDWGVMGLGYQPGNACVTSTFRLSKKTLLDQLFKVSVHELGHTQGLPHCENKGCYMQDAEGGNPADNEHEFCPKCRKVLESKGWVF
jgi:archaemetzincin